MEEYLERLLPTFFVIRHGLDKDINKLVDNSENELKRKHLNRLGLIKGVASTKISA